VGIVHYLSGLNVYALTQIQGDSELVCPTIQIADSLIPSGISNFVYVFSHNPYWAHNPSQGAFHSSEIAFVFSTLPSTYPYQANEIPLANQMTTLWTNFMTSGNPLKPVVPAGVVWPQYTADTKTRIVLDITDGTLKQWKTSQCAFWNTIYQMQYPQ